MGALSDIVSVAVSALTTQVQEAGFGVPLIVDYHTRFAERVRTYSGSPAGLTAMLADGFTVNDAAYLAASAVVAQSPAVDLFAIGRRALAPDLQVDFTPTALNSTLYEIPLRGPAGLTAVAQFTSDANATVAEIVAGLVAAINTAAVGITATDVASTTVRCKAASAGLWFSATAKNINRLSAKQTHADPGIATDLAAILAETQDFYGVTLTTQGALENVAAATWIESNKRLGALGSQDTEIAQVTTGDVASTIKTATQLRTAVWYATYGDQFRGAALLGSFLPLEPGQVIAWGRQLAGQTADTLTDTQIGYIKGKKANWFTTYGGKNITRDGTTAGGSYMDLIRDRDWLEARIQEGEFQVLTSSNKIPFTDKGAAAVTARVKAVLQTAVDVGVLAAEPAPVVIAPKVADVSATDKGNRIYKTINFSATLAGAIQSMAITGTVTV